MLRTRQTADVIAEATGLSPKLLPDVCEYDFGEASGLTWEEIGQRYPALLAAVRARTAEYPSYPGEEGREAFRSRVCNALWQLPREHRDDTVAVVTHAGPIVVACLEALGLPYRRPAAFAVSNCSLTSLEFEHAGARLLSSNDVCHLKE